MPYFFILPAYAALLLALIGAAVVMWFAPRFKSASGYLWGGAIGSLVGFIIINLLIWMASLFSVWFAQKVSLPKWPHEGVQIFVAAILLIGPFIGSAIGVLAGFAAGAYFVFKRRRKADLQTQDLRP